MKSRWRSLSKAVAASSEGSGDCVVWELLQLPESSIFEASRPVAEETKKCVQFIQDGHVCMFMCEYCILCFR